LERLRVIFLGAFNIENLDELLGGKPFYTTEPLENTTQPDVYKNFSDDLIELIRKLEATVKYFQGTNETSLSLSSSLENPIKPWESEIDFENDIISNTRLDHILVAVCRVLQSNWVIQNQHREFNGLTLSLALSDYCLHDSDILDYCLEHTMRWGRSAEGAPVNMGGLTEALCCDIRIIMRDRENKNLMEDIDGKYFPKKSGEFSIGSVILILRPGHYDLLYPEHDEELCLTLGTEDPGSKSYLKSNSKSNSNSQSSCGGGSGSGFGLRLDCMFDCGFGPHLDIQSSSEKAALELARTQEKEQQIAHIKSRMLVLDTIFGNHYNGKKELYVEDLGVYTREYEDLNIQLSNIN
jgi:hypothetical protein